MKQSHPILMRMASVLLVWFGLLASAYAIEDPSAFTQSITNKVLAQIRQNPQDTVRIVYREVVPHVSFYTMARLVAGRKAWMAADKPLRLEFTKALKKKIILSYANVLEDMGHDTVTFNPVRGGYAEKKKVLVTGRVDRQSKPSVMITFKLTKVKKKNQETAAWKAYDVIVEGVSILKGFQSQLSETLKTQGMGAAVEKLKEKKRA